MRERLVSVLTFSLAEKEMMAAILKRKDTWQYLLSTHYQYMSKRTNNKPCLKDLTVQTERKKKYNNCRRG